MMKERLHEIIFEADTKKGKLFDIILLIAIIISVLGVILSSVESIDKKIGHLLTYIEWIFTLLFTIEYLLRIYSIIPTYLVFLYPPIHVLVDIRAIRLIRIFRIFKLSRYLRGANVMQIALKSSRPKIVVFLLSVILIVIILGTLMYIVEGQKNGFENIPKSIYWSVVTLTTVGYGNVVPVTTFGKFLASIIMILGYGIIAVPTGIVSAAIAKSANKVTTQSCRSCSKEGHDLNAKHCKFCGFKLNE